MSVFRSHQCVFAFLLTIQFLTASAVFSDPTVKTKRDPKMKEINSIWMKQIHGESKKKTTGTVENQTENGVKKPIISSDSKPDLTKEPGKYQLNNPGKNISTDKRITGTPKTLFPEEQGTSFVSIILRFIGITVVMLGGFYLVMRFIKSRSGTVVGGSDLVRIVASVPLVQGKFIQIVDMAGRLIVLGVSDAGINLLTTVDDARTADHIRLWQSNRAVSPVVPSGLMERLTRIIKNADFRFWTSSAESNKPGSMRQKLDFTDMLREHGGTFPEENRNEASISDDIEKLSKTIMENEKLSGSDALSESALPLSEQNFTYTGNPDEDPAQRQLQDLLRKQKQRLAAMKKADQ